MPTSPSFRNYILFSIFFHILIVVVLIFSEKFFPAPALLTPVAIDFISPEQLTNLHTTTKVRPSRKALPKLQVVEQSEKSRNEEIPDDARFLSIKNQKVERQTVAAQRGEFQNLHQVAQTKKGVQNEAAKTSSNRKDEIARQLFKGFQSGETVPFRHVKQDIQDSGQPLDSSENSGPSSQTSDYIKDVDTGLETVLNTREFKYYSYYNRIRKQLAQHWEGRVREKLSKLFREGRAPAATTQDRVTKLMIILNDQGTLVGVKVLSDSGVRDLDDAAIEAFRAAAPFPNPPKGIVEGDGTVKIRWDFVLET